MISVFIIDDHQILIDAIKQHLSTVEDVEVVGTSVSALSGIDAVFELRPDVLLLDISMAELDGIKCAERILKKNPEQRIIILSTHQEVSIIKKVIKIGVLGYVSKANGISTIDKAIKQVHNGEKFLGEHISQAYMADLLNSSNPRPVDLAIIPKLTSREKEVLELIASEATTQEIGSRLHISPNTVETHRRNLISKFQVRNSVGLVRKAMELRLLE